ncbi:MAG: vanadium-dependent haloperoxidase [Verrucomicrobiales bacterium]|nr:vanadium-dependent haloperoxidase [Verrucomicrobiales bacterium]
MKMNSFLCCLTALLFNGLARADVISDWNKTASDYLTQNASSQYGRGMAMVHVAQFDAVNAVLGGYTPYVLDVVAPGASPEAAAAQAAYTVLTNLSRGGLSTLNSALSRSLTAVPDGPAKDAGIALGRLAATRIIQLRAADNPDLPITPPSSQAVGKWRITPPNSSPGQGGNMRYMLPWTMRSPAQFRPGPPPALASDQYAADLEEVRLLGGRVSTNRTPDIAQAADFHYAGSRTFLNAVVARPAVPLIESARLFALVYMLEMDATIAFFEAQYAYNLWRPYSAIRLAENDGNDATTADPAWNPFFDTPNHPEYPSGTCTGTSAIIHFLISIHGDDFGFTVRSENTPSAGMRTYPRLSAMIDDAVVARIAAGAHFRNSCVVGVELGQRIARHALENFLRPVPHFTGAARLSTGEFQLHFNPGRSVSYVIETSGDLSQWMPWQTNIYGAILQNDPGAPADRRFFRALIQPGVVE